MCYLGQPLAMEELIAKPEHSLITQSRDASYHPGCDAKRNIRVNGDGFGLAFYHAAKLEKGCCLVKFATPGTNYKHLASLPTSATDDALICECALLAYAHMPGLDIKSDSKRCTQPEYMLYHIKADS
jgi:predicted glutamine amidotransferase